MLNNRKKSSVSLDSIDYVLLAFFIWCLLRAFFTPYTPFIYNHKLQILFGCIILHFFIKYSVKDELILKLNQKSSTVYFFVFLLLLSGLSQAIIGILQLYEILPNRNLLFKITGSFFNPTPYALYLSIVFPVALHFTFFCKLTDSDFLLHRFAKYIAPVSLISIVTILPATMIRAAWIGAIVGSTVIFWFAFKESKIKIPKSIINSFSNSTGRILYTLFFITAIIMYSSFIYKLKRDSTNGKIFIWELTIEKILKKPIFGYGLGRFEAEYNIWQSEYFQNNSNQLNERKGLLAGNTKYAFNDFLEMASEIGLVGLTLFILLIVVSISDLKKTSMHVSNDFVIDPNLISLLISFVSISFFSFPSYNIPVYFIFFFLTGILSAYTSKNRPIIITSRVIYTLSLVCFLGSYFFANEINKRIIANKNWLQADLAYKSDQYKKANFIYNKNLQLLRFEGLFLQHYGTSLQKDNKNEEAIQILLKASKLTSDYMLFCSLGDAYKSLKEYDKAIIYYSLASFMVPHKIYPEYLLAKLYNDCGQKEKAKEKAIKILEKENKAESYSAVAIKNEMRKIVNK
jgi:tetratricopeptide (TPR) repeat protein